MLIFVRGRTIAQARCQAINIVYVFGAQPGKAYDRAYNYIFPTRVLINRLNSLVPE